ncbi:MAG: DNA mismatch repair protein MutS [Thermoanaerobaculia bacterium]|nr:DNA mismatch repair protein MutS [Thermoanaerobaculia bacterium]
MSASLVDGLTRLARRFSSGARREPPRPGGGRDELCLFLDLRSQDLGPPTVDARTAADLDFDALFARVDRCASAVGQQWLWARLRTPAGEPEALEGFDALVTALGAPGASRDELRRSLARLTGASSYLLPYLLHGELPERPATYRLAPVLTGAAFGAFAASFALGVPGVLALVAICAVNVVVRLSFRAKVAPALGSLPAVRALLKTALDLARPGSGLPDGLRARLEETIAPLRGLLRTTGWLAIETDAKDELSRLFYEYVNLVFLLDVNALLFSLETLSKRRDALRALFDAVGETDGALSTAAFRESLPFWCRPRIVATREGLAAEEAFHPILEAPVPSSVALDSSLLVTGSNMSGKTTFLKTLGVNALLARTLATCAARRWEAPAFEVVSAMGRNESLTEGTSYYLAEVRRVGELIEATAGTTPRLFLLDELFRGTNTLERIAAGKAVLARLARGPHLVAVASHDLELVPLLHGAYVPYHFREEIAGGVLSFDYRLRPGPSSTRNAIALLAWAAYPPEVVADAFATVEALHSAGRFDAVKAAPGD